VCVSEQQTDVIIGATFRNAVFVLVFFFLKKYIFADSQSQGTLFCCLFATFTTLTVYVYFSANEMARN
jgi:hypothetical protein